ncbi:hypothetical protein [Rhodocaloribacter sp.]
MSLSPRNKRARRLLLWAAASVGLLGLASCDLTPSGEQVCRGANNLQAEHEALLTCAGWLGFVETNVCAVEYVAVIPAEKKNTKILGRAFCGEDNILVATTGERQGFTFPPLPAVEIATTIVHETAHLVDGCANGEDPALAAEEAFRADLCAAFEAGKEGCERARGYCMSAAPRP